MAIQELYSQEVRIRDAESFKQMPNNTQYAGTATKDDGFFAQLGRTAQGQPAYFAVAASEYASHLILRSATPKEVADVGKVAQDDVCLAITGGTGRVFIPFTGDANAGQKLTTDANGYATPWTTGNDLHIVGEALEDVSVDPATGYGWGDALITLPTSTVGSVHTSENANG